MRAFQRGTTYKLRHSDTFFLPHLSCSLCVRVRQKECGVVGGVGALLWQVSFQQYSDEKFLFFPPSFF